MANVANDQLNSSMNTSMNTSSDDLAWMTASPEDGEIVAEFAKKLTKMIKQNEKLGKDLKSIEAQTKYVTDQICWKPFESAIDGAIKRLEMLKVMAKMELDAATTSRLSKVHAERVQSNERSMNMCSLLRNLTDDAISHDVVLAQFKMAAETHMALKWVDLWKKRCQQIKFEAADELLSFCRHLEDAAYDMYRMEPLILDEDKVRLMHMRPERLALGQTSDGNIPHEFDEIRVEAFSTIQIPSLRYWLTATLDVYDIHDGRNMISTANGGASGGDIGSGTTATLAVTLDGRIEDGDRNKTVIIFDLKSGLRKCPPNTNREYVVKALLKGRAVKNSPLNIQLSAWHGENGDANGLKKTRNQSGPAPSTIPKYVGYTYGVAQQQQGQNTSMANGRSRHKSTIMGDRDSALFQRAMDALPPPSGPSSPNSSSMELSMPTASASAIKRAAASIVAAAAAASSSVPSSPSSQAARPRLPVTPQVAQYVASKQASAAKQHVAPKGFPFQNGSGGSTPRRSGVFGSVV